MDWIVNGQESGLSLQRFLAQKLGSGFSAKRIKRSLEKGACQMNGRLERFPHILVGKGDRVTWLEPLSPVLPEKKELQILWTEGDFLAIAKPAGVKSEDIPKNIGQETALAHRLDRDTTGVLLLGRTQAAADALADLFRQRQVEKEYQAIVDGHLQPREGEVKNYLGKKSIYEGQTLWGQVTQNRGQYAETRWCVLSYGKQASHIACFPYTGRTHQIRVHIADLGHPILGDLMYGRQQRSPYRPGRCLLHCKELRFPHPQTKQEVIVTAPLPEDFSQALATLFEGEK